jgi:RND superfamily putative drug exporter
MFDRLGRLVIRLRYVFVLAWLVAAALFGALAPSLSQAGFADETSFLPRDAESLSARHIVAQAFPGDSSATVALIVFSRTGGLTDADRAAIEGLRPYFEGSGHADTILRYITAEGSPSLASMLRSQDGVVELARLDMSTPSFLPRTNSSIDAIRAHLASDGTLPSGMRAQVSGQAGIGRDYLAAIRDGTERTTFVTIALVVLVLLLIYRAPLAALAPLLTIGSAFLVSRGVLGFLAQGGWQLSSILDSFIVVLVFGVGTDYTIFLISRFREELGRHGHDDAIRVTVSRISAVIAASAATVIVGLTSMVAARFGMIQSTGPALALTVFITLLAGLTLTPALLAIFGRRLFWPRHELTRTVDDEAQGFWAALARRITTKPGLLAAAVLVVLAVPALGLPQLKENFDVLSELPSSAESRQGYETLSGHFPEGQLMPLSVLVRLPGASSSYLTSSTGLARIEALQHSLAALPNVQSVRSVVDPMGTGSVSDFVRPSVELAVLAEAFAKPPSNDLNVQLGDAGLAGVVSAASYVDGLSNSFPNISTAQLKAASTDIGTLKDGLTAARKQALTSNQIDTIVARIQSAASSAGASGGAEATAQLQQLKAYLDELGAAKPAVAAVAAYKNAQTATAKLTAATSADLASSLQLVSSLQELSNWFKGQPAFYFAPSYLQGDPASSAAREAMTAARSRLPAELDALASSFSPSDLYAPPELRSAYVSGDGLVARLYVTTKMNPYDTKSFDTVRAMRNLLDGEAAAMCPAGSAAACVETYVGGATAEFSDVQETISGDFLRVAAITIIGILIVLILLLRALVAPLYLVLTVLLSYATSLSLSAFILQGVLGQPGMNYFIPLMVFVLLVALGSDYNIFLMSRVREEGESRGRRPGIRVASARTGTVITSAGLILAGTFGALVSSPLQLLFQVGLTVGLGVLIDTFVVRSLLVPALTAFVGERAWWPFHRRGASQ